MRHGVRVADPVRPLWHAISLLQMTSLIVALARRLADLVRDLLPGRSADVDDAQRDDVTDAVMDDDGMDASGL